jgi:preprotein translocase SecE subunit
MIARIKNYVQNILLEWQKVSKPDMEQVRGSTVVVLIASGILGVFIWLVDGSSAQPTWQWPAELILVAIPIAVFILSKDLETRRSLATAIACVPLVIILVSQYIIKPENPLTGFGMSFLRNIFLR